MIKISVLISLYKCQEYLERYFLNILEIENLNEIEFIIIHNDPSDNETNTINSFLNTNQQVNYQYLAVPREGLYKSWNRGIQLSKALYIAIWNVDDIRFPDSLKLQAEALDGNENIALVYGDLYISTSFDNKNLIYNKTYDINKSSWHNSFQDGAFIMWRKSVHDTIGYFDEQFIIGGDRDFWFRITDKHKAVKISAPLGIYLQERGKGISKNSNKLNYEFIIIGLRYGFYPRCFFNPFGCFKAFKMVNPFKIYYLEQTKKQKILLYHSFYIYLISLFTLIIMIPYYIADFFIDFDKYNVQYIKTFFKTKNDILSPK